MPQNFYELVWIFIIYAFGGWCMEVSYAALDRGIFVNRGFLNGPYCPIYGCGVVIVVAALTPLKENLLFLFFGSVLLTTVLEYITGLILEKVFRNKWWDYSDKPFNLQGYVCLKFSVYWGFACTFIMDILHPMIYKFITMIPFIPGVALLSALMAVFAADCVITVMTILDFNKKLKVMDEVAAKIHKISDEIGENIYEGVSLTVEKSEEFQETHEELLTRLSDTRDNLMELPEAAKNRLADSAESAKEKLVGTTMEAKAILADSAETMRTKLTESAETAREKVSRVAKLAEKEELEKKYRELLAQTGFGFRRLMRAFPDMKSRDFNESLQKYKVRFSVRRKNGRRAENGEGTDSHDSEN